MKTLPIMAVEYQSLSKQKPRSRVVVTALLCVLLIATILSFGGQYTPAGQKIQDGFLFFVRGYAAFSQGKRDSCSSSNSSSSTSTAAASAISMAAKAAMTLQWHVLTEHK
jgi:hypothetical protein